MFFSIVPGARRHRWERSSKRKHSTSMYKTARTQFNSWKLINWIENWMELARLKLFCEKKYNLWLVVLLTHVLEKWKTSVERVKRPPKLLIQVIVVFFRKIHFQSQNGFIFLRNSVNISWTFRFVRTVLLRLRIIYSIWTWMNLKLNRQCLLRRKRKHARNECFSTDLSAFSIFFVHCSHVTRIKKPRCWTGSSLCWAKKCQPANTKTS